MNPFSEEVLAHVRANAPALAAGVLDYGGLLDDCGARFDFFDSRGHLATVPGPEFADKARARAGALAARGVVAGDRILMVANNTEEYLSTLLGALLLGAVPCAVAPPPAPSRSDSAGVRHLRAAIAVVGPKLVVVPAAAVAALSDDGDSAVLRYEDLSGGQGRPLPPRPPAGPHDIHHIQLTSGSTSEPKAVLLTHRNVAHNLGLLAYSMGVRPGGDRMFSWLPLYHDMGLVMVLGGLFYGAPVALMSPLGFLRDPLSWARHMTSHRSTVTAGPTFAYRAVTEALRRSAAGGGDIDLSALRHAFVGAEPIGYRTLRDFAESFGPLGLSPDALVPSYGMAESVLATTLATRSAPGGPGDFGRVRCLTADAGDVPLVSCGPPIEGMRVAIVDSGGSEVNPGTVGDIRIGGYSLMSGYQNADGTVAAPPGGWHDTGDRGLLCDGELFVVGRSKEMLIIRGRNLPPYDVECAIGDLPEVGQGNAVVFSVPGGNLGVERNVAVVGTVVAADDGKRTSLRAQVAAAVRGIFGFTLDEVVLVPRRAIPRTTSGKIQRVKVRELYLSGGW
jgi:fatty-acyl-CoA synthase